jgi:hypothetical protein
MSTVPLSVPVGQLLVATSKICWTEKFNFPTIFDKSRKLNFRHGNDNKFNIKQNALVMEMLNYKNDLVATPKGMPIFFFFF